MRQSLSPSPLAHHVVHLGSDSENTRGHYESKNKSLPVINCAHKKGKRGDEAAINSCFTGGGYTRIKRSWQNVPLSCGSFITFNPNKNNSLPKKKKKSLEPYTIRTCVSKTSHSSRTTPLMAPVLSVSARKQNPAMEIQNQCSN